MRSKILTILYECINETNKEIKGRKIGWTTSTSLCKNAAKCNCFCASFVLAVCFCTFGCAAPLSPSKATSEVIKCNFWWRSHLCEEGESFAGVRAPGMNSWPRHSGPVFCSSSFSIVNEEDRRGRGLLVLIYPEGSLGITINSPLLAHSTSLHRHCQFVPIREAGFWVSAVRSRSGPTGESHPDHTGLDCTLIPWGGDSPQVVCFPSYVFWSLVL